MIKPLLSISIATYDSSTYIGKTLNCIIPQLDDDVELLMIDDTSLDNSKEAVKEYVKNEPRIHYICLTLKGVIDQDYDKSIEYTKCEYCYFFGNASIKLILGAHYPFWRGPYMAIEYKSFSSTYELSGEGVSILEFVKVGGKSE
jgi:glycosyltransferase involved in cell wall biosynthesis